ncbi:MAG: DUF302 domain-containing protein [Marinobacter sp.]|uniref:DUF302 domain-containing protein n=1 Tax=Marinobacter sp. TaxID=50741 RepID=UPI0034A0669A
MRIFQIFAIALLLVASNAFADNGLVMTQSKHSVSDTGDKLVSVIEDKGMKVFARVNHAEGAKSADLELRPTEVVIFGNPKVGTPLMLCSQSVAIDLPQKMLIWEDEAGDVWLAYNNPDYLAERHDIEGCDEVLGKVSTALGNFAAAAAR